MRLRRRHLNLLRNVAGLQLNVNTRTRVHRDADVLTRLLLEIGHLDRNRVAAFGNIDKCVITARIRLFCPDYARSNVGEQYPGIGNYSSTSVGNCSQDRPRYSLSINGTDRNEQQHNYG